MDFNLLIGSHHIKTQPLIPLFFQEIMQQLTPINTLEMLQILELLVIQQALLQQILLLELTTV